MYEMFIGYPPFVSADYKETFQKIINWRTNLVFPEDIHISPAAEHLIRRLLCGAEQRLGLYGADEIKAHPFFRGVDWENIRQQRAPFIPELKSIIDTSYFPPELDHSGSTLAESPSSNSAGMDEEPGASTMVSILRKKDLAFVGYSFRRFESLSKTGYL